MHRGTDTIMRIFDYLDYRHYLADLFNEMHARDPRFSYRAFARLAGSSSPNYLQLIRDRKLNISDRALATLSQNLGLSEKEHRHFEVIVAFDHAKTHTEKDRWFHTLLRTREHARVTRLRKEQYEYFSHWYMPVIRELLTCADYPDDPAWIASRTVPPLKAGTVKKAIASLESLGLIRREGNTWVHAQRVVSTPSEVLSLAVTEYHRRVILLGREAITRFGPGQRDIRAVTIGMSSRRYAELKERMERFWNELLAFAESQEEVDEVYQVNLQMFPMSEPGEEDA